MMMVYLALANSSQLHLKMKICIRNTLLLWTFVLTQFSLTDGLARRDGQFTFEHLWRMWEDNIYSKNQTETVQQFLDSPESLQQVVTLANFTHLILTATLQADHMNRGSHSYDDLDLLNKSSGDDVNQELCLQQLNDLAERAARQQDEALMSKDIDLFRLMDTYGRVPAGFAHMETVWPGQYRECLGLKMKLGENRSGMRHCMASLALKYWPSSGVTKHYGLEVGVCLPSACDSLDYGRKFELVEKLIKFNLMAPMRDAIHVGNLFCPPDSSSFYSKWWLQPRTSITISLIFLWIVAQICATLASPARPIEGRKEVSELNRALSIRNSFAELVRLQRSRSNSAGGQEDVDLRIVEGIKVISMVFVMMGHFLMNTIGSWKGMSTLNIMQLSNYLFIVSNEVPAFLISIFFVITGILVAYHEFNTKQAHLLAFSPKRWTFLILKRYMRLLPVYAFVVAYCKYIVKFTGSGPFWDYGTSALAPRKLCEQESWWSTLFFTANFKPMQASCVTPSWYVASDMQFIAISPILLTALARRPTITKTLMLIYIVCSYTMNALEIYFNDIPDLTPIYRNNLMSYGYMTTFLNSVYTKPYYRVNAFIVGILLGHHLFDWRNAKQDSPSAQSARESNFIRSTKRFYPIFTLVFSLSLLHFGVLCRISPFYGETSARFLVTLFFPFLTSIASIVVGGYIILVATGGGARRVNHFLGAPFWRPFSKINLSLLLCHCEVVSYIAQSLTQPIYLEFFTHLSLLVLAITLSYIVAVLLFIFVEAPSGRLLRIFILSRLSSK